MDNDKQSGKNLPGLVDDGSGFGSPLLHLQVSHLTWPVVPTQSASFSHSKWFKVNITKDFNFDRDYSFILVNAVADNLSYLIQDLCCTANLADS